MAEITCFHSVSFVYLRRKSRTEERKEGAEEEVELNWWYMQLEYFIQVLVSEYTTSSGQDCI